MLARVFRPIIVAFSKDRELYGELKELLGRYPRDLSLYKQAFTHRSALRGTGSKAHNERLEYLGDAVLDVVVADYLYKRFPTSKEGMLTQIRAKLVNRITLSRVARKHSLEHFLVSQINLHVEGKFVYSNMVEALVGAVYLDLGYKFSKEFILTRLLKDFINADLEELEYDFKSRVLEWGQKNKQSIDFVSEIHPGPKTHTNMFSSNVLINGEVAGYGTGRSKKEAEQNAARCLWEQWEKN